MVPVSAAEEGAALELTQALRRGGFTVDVGYRGNVTRRLRRAHRLDARAAILLGEDERARGAVAVRDLDTGEQVEVPLAELEDRLAPYR